MQTIVYSATDKYSLNNVEKWYTYFKKRKIENVPIILVGHKIGKETQKIKCEEGKAMADKYNWSFFEVSALTGKGVDEAFIDIIKKANIYLKYLQIVDKKKKRIFSFSKRIMEEQANNLSKILGKKVFFTNDTYKANDIKTYLDIIKKRNPMSYFFMILKI